MNTDFLKQMQESLEKGEKNQEIVDKLNEIEEKSYKINPEDAEKSLEKRLEHAGRKTVNLDPETLNKANEEYDKKMEELAKIDQINKDLAMLIELDDMVKLTLQDVFTHLQSLTVEYQNDFIDPIFDSLRAKMTEMHDKYDTLFKK